MGMSLNVDLGFGIEIPIDETGLSPELSAQVVKALEPSDGFIIDVEEYDGEIYTTYDEYEIFDALNKKFPLLIFKFGSSHEYWTAAAIFVKSSHADGYYGAARLVQTGVWISPEVETQLREAADIFGLEFNPLILAFPSYG